MKYTDITYGDVVITEPVILELINTKAFQRLKDINQYGYQPLHIKPETELPKVESSRYAHSMGVFLLLKKYGAPLEEQIAGLLHDISHSAFSHCIDYIIEKQSLGGQDHQDKIHDEYVLNSDVVPILKKYGVELEYILNDKNFPLKENDLPDICADRIDYSLKGAQLFGELSETKKKEILDSLKVLGGIWYFTKYEVAKDYAQLFSKMNKTYWANFDSAAMFAGVGDCLGYALERGYISMEDMYQTDTYVLGKMKKKIDVDEELSVKWQRMNKKGLIVEDSGSYNCLINCKSRMIDPLFMDNGELVRLSDRFTEWKKELKVEGAPKKYCLRFL